MTVKGLVLLIRFIYSCAHVVADSELKCLYPLMNDNNESIQVLFLVGKQSNNIVFQNNEAFDT